MEVVQAFLLILPSNWYIGPVSVHVYMPTKLHQLCHQLAIKIPLAAATTILKLCLFLLDFGSSSSTSVAADEYALQKEQDVHAF